MELTSKTPRWKNKFFLKAISKLMYKKLKNKVKDKFLSEDAPGDNFPGLYWRSS